MPQGAWPSCTPLAPALCLWAETCSSRSIFSAITLKCHQAGASPRQGKDHTSSWMRLYQVLHLACWHHSQPAQGSAPAWRCLQQGEGTSAPPILDSTFSWRKPRRKPQRGCCAHPIPAWHLGGHFVVSPWTGSLGQILCTQTGFIQAFSLQDG